MIRVIDTESDIANGSDAKPLAMSITMAGEAITPTMDVANKTQNMTVATWSASMRVARGPR